MKQIYENALVAAFSHEQMTPLNSIINLASMLIERFLQKKEPES